MHITQVLELSYINYIRASIHQELINKAALACRSIKLFALFVEMQTLIEKHTFFIKSSVKSRALIVSTTLLQLRVQDYLIVTLIVSLFRVSVANFSSKPIEDVFGF